MVEEITKAPWRHKSNSKSMIVQYNQKSEGFKTMQCKDFISYLNRNPNNRRNYIEQV